MAQSFGVPSRQCSVAEFDAQRVAGQPELAWKNYCDCMFIEAVEVTDFMSGGTALIRCTDGKCINQNDGYPLTLTVEQCAQSVIEICNRNGTAYSINVYGLTRPTPEWTKCMSNYCIWPGGCPNPAVPSLIMPFNADPGSALSPWTDVGAAARMIPKRNAGFFYDTTALLHIDLHAYEPLKLWQTFWKNPFLFGVLMAKIQLIPIAGAAYFTALTFTGPPVFLIPAAIESAERQGLDPMVEVFKAAGMGLIESAKFCVAYIGKCGFGIPGACGVAMAVQKAAQDQINTGEINNVASKEGKAIIIFLAKSGGDLVDAVMSMIANPDKGFVLVFEVLEQGFATVARMLGTDPEVAVMKKTCEIIATVFGIAGIIAKGIDSRTDGMMVADNVADYLLGFRPSEYFALIAAGKKQSALDSAQASMATKGVTVEGMIERATAIVDVLDKVINELSKIAEKIGGAFDDVLGVLGGIKSDIGGATGAVVAVGQQVDAVTREALGLPPTGPVTGTAPVQAATIPPMPPDPHSLARLAWMQTYGGGLKAPPPKVARPTFPGPVGNIAYANAAVFAARQKIQAQANAGYYWVNRPALGANITEATVSKSGSAVPPLIAAFFAAKLLLF